MAETEQKVVNNDIAIIGISVKFPQIETLEEFRNTLQEGRQCISSCPETRRKDIDDYLDYCNVSSDNRTYRQAGYFEEIDKFDYRFFNISPKEAILIDPTQRMLLETSFHALEDAGYTKKMLSKKRVGVFTGFPAEYSSKVYHNLIVETDQKLESSLFSGNLPAILPSRLSYFLDLRGPAAVIDTSCSSSLSALYFACQTMISGDCEMAVVNGVNIFVYPILNEIVGTIGILSSDGKTKAFDDQADGVGQGEGVVAIVIKKLHDAIRDQDHIYAVIKAAAVNQDGKSIGITAPNPAAQTDVIIQAWNKAGISPETVSYIETHGTGTKLGDPTEITGINNAFKQFTNQRQVCAIGSVKTNLGHTLGAAGLAGIVKTTMQLYYKELYPICNFNVPNKRINFLNSKVYVNSSLKKWKQTGIKRAGVSSFGITGTNCHVVLEEYSKHDTNSVAESNKDLIFIVSAKDKTSLIEYVKKYYHFFRKNNNIDYEEACYSSCLRKDFYDYRAIIIANCVEDLTKKLSILIDDFQAASGIYLSINCLDKIPINEECSDKNNLLENICQKLLINEEVDFSTIFTRNSYKHVPLLAYPFKKERVWIEIPQKKKQLTTQLHNAVWDESTCSPTVSDDKTLVLTQKNIEPKLKQNIQKYCSQTKFFALSKNHTLLTIEQYLQTESVKQIVYFLEDLSSETYVQQIFSLLELVKLADRICKEGIRLVIVMKKSVKTSQDDEINPYTSLITGALKTITWEFSKIQPRCIDIDSFENESWVKELSRKVDEFIICYRGKKRYCEYIKKIDTNTLKSEGIFLKKEGVYVIIGGNGRIGRKVAKYMTDNEFVKIIILCRTDEEANRIYWDRADASADKAIYNKYTEFKEIEEKARMLAFKVIDISDALQVEQVFTELHNEYGPVNGVIQAAVDDNGEKIKNLTVKMVEDSIQAKVQGTVNVGNVLRKTQHTDFFILFSTVMTLISAPGNATYTMTNNFLNSYQMYLNDLGIRTYTINWPEWKDIDLHETLKTDEDKSMFKKISPTNAMECFEYIVKNQLAHAFVGDVNKHSLLWKHSDSLPFQFYDVEYAVPAHNFADAQLKEPLEQVKLSGRKTNEYTDSEKLLAMLYSEFLGYSEININENFFNLGGDSIFAMKIAAQLQDSGIRLEGIDIMRYQTIADIGTYIDSIK